MNHRRNTCGQAYALSVLTPIRDGEEAALVRCLNALQEGPGSPLAKVPGTHIARWVVIGDVVYEGERQRRADHLSAGRLLFTSNFDGPLAPYLQGLRTSLGEVADRIWGHCSGYPGRADAEAFAAYLCSHQLECSLFFAAYGGRTVEQVERSLATRRNVIDFALRAQRMGAAELQSAFREAFAG
ncbi:MAG TPA: hypothetical protein VNV44_09750 [Solirubrobacteraceae bacterium]|nr:hypothetical protein [Solirubrobacteraceae bacterium]